MYSMMTVQRWLGVLLVAAACRVDAQASPPPPLDEWELNQFTRLVEQRRQRIAPPAARFDWCAIPLAFDAAGTLRGDTIMRARAIARNSRECAQRDSVVRAAQANDRRPPVPRGETHVTVHTMTVYADSLVILATANHEDYRVAEEYVLGRRDGALNVMVSRQTMVVVH